MKKIQAQKLLDKTILEFGDTLADILFEAQLLVYTFKIVRTGETVLFDKGTGRYTRSGIGEWFNAVSVTDISKRKTSNFTIGGRHGDRKSIVKRFPKTLNTEFRWLLVSGYEAYERFLKQIYAVLGYCDRNLWRCADFGNERTVKQISGMTLVDFIKRVKQSPSLHPGKIRTLLAHRFGRIQSSGGRNSIMSNNEVITYAEYIDLIEIMRHIIVHEQATVVPADFFDRLKKKWKRETPLSDALKALILNQVFKQSDKSWELWFLEHSSSPIHDVHARPLGTLIERLGSYACLQYREAARHFGNKPFWE